VAYGVISRHMFCMFTFTFSQFAPTGSRKSLSGVTNFVFPLLEWLSVLVTTKELVRMHKIHVKKDSSEP